MLMNEINPDRDGGKAFNFEGKKDKKVVVFVESSSEEGSDEMEFDEEKVQKQEYEKVKARSYLQRYKTSI